jgi:uncharacterized protein YceH (UPF0502 family)
MNATEAEILTAIDGLKRLSVVLEGSSSRVPRFEHNLNRVLGVQSQAVALLATLLLRGPQTTAELRLNTARLHNFADISSVEAFLDELAARNPPLAAKLPRSAGERESRWTHLLCGEVTQYERPQNGAVEDSVSPGQIEALKAEQKELAEKVTQLQAIVEHLAAELGISIDAIARG